MTTREQLVEKCKRLSTEVANKAGGSPHAFRALSELDAAIEELAASLPSQDESGRRALANFVRDGIASFIGDNWPNRKHTLEEIETGVRAIEINPPASPEAPAAPKDHEIRELVNKLTEVARDYHATEQLRERIAGLVVPLARGVALTAPPSPAAPQGVQAEPVHWRAVLDEGQREQQLKTTLHVVGFRDRRAAEGWIAQELDFGGWKYTLEPLYAAPPSPPAVQPASPAYEGIEDDLYHLRRHIEGKSVYGSAYALGWLSNIERALAKPAVSPDVQELVEVLRGAVDMAWAEDSHQVEFDGTVVFGPGYDFEGPDGHRRIEFLGEVECIVWPKRGGNWSAYCTHEGNTWFERFATAEDAKEACMRLLDKVIPEHPAMKARATLSKYGSKQ